MYSSLACLERWLGKCLFVKFWVCSRLASSPPPPPLKQKQRKKNSVCTCSIPFCVDWTTSLVPLPLLYSNGETVHLYLFCFCVGRTVQPGVLFSKYNPHRVFLKDQKQQHQSHVCGQSPPSPCSATKSEWAWPLLAECRGWRSPVHTHEWQLTMTFSLDFWFLNLYLVTL